MTEFNPVRFDHLRFRGPQPRGIGDVVMLAKLGVKTVMALNHTDPNEGAMWCRETGMAFWNVRMGAIFPPSNEEMRLAMAVLGQSHLPRLEPIYVHCRSGVDRTGIVVAYYRMRYNGWKFEDARDEMLSTGMHWWLRWWAQALKEYR